jgi:TRAP-type C4-dicarboxylate transport system substrate-binding protein
VQKYIVLTGHIVDHLNTVVSGKQWKQFNDSEKKLFNELAQEAAQKAGADIVARETELIEVFKKKGLSVTGIDRDDFRNAVLKNVKFEDFGYRKADWDRIQEIK